MLISPSPSSRTGWVLHSSQGLWTLTKAWARSSASRFCSAHPPLTGLTPPPEKTHPPDLPLSGPRSSRLQVPPGDKRVQMSTLPPNHHGDIMKASQVNMATATSTKVKPASKAGANANPKQKTQMHRRSRTGLLPFSWVLFRLSREPQCAASVLLFPSLRSLPRELGS